MAEKLKPCCANYTSQHVRAQADLTRVVRKVLSAEARNRDATKLREQIPILKEQIKEIERNQIDHEASHAGEAVPA